METGTMSAWLSQSLEAREIIVRAEEVRMDGWMDG
jgi:hypothetical protein